MILSIIIAISVVTFLSWPSVKFMRRYSWNVHIQTLKKAAILWTVSTSPIIGAVLLSIPSDRSNLLPELGRALQSHFTLSEMYVYSAAFLSPILYVFFDAFNDIDRTERKFTIEFAKEIRHRISRMSGIIVRAAIILFVTFLAFSSSKTDPERTESTFLSILFLDQVISFYLSSLVIWYCVILYGEESSFSLEHEDKNRNQDFSEMFNQRQRGK